MVCSAHHYEHIYGTGGRRPPVLKYRGKGAEHPYRTRYRAGGPIPKKEGPAALPLLRIGAQGPLSVYTYVTYVLSTPDLPKGEGVESTSVIGGAQLPQTP